MMSEVDSISKSYEDMQAQNKRLLLELGNKEDVTIQVASEVLLLPSLLSPSPSLFSPSPSLPSSSGSRKRIGNEDEEATGADED